MDRPHFRNPESGSETSVYQSALSGTSSGSTVISLALAPYDGVLKTPIKANLKASLSQEEQPENRLRGQNLNENYGSSSFSNSTTDLRDIIYSPINQLNENDSLEIAQNAMTATANVTKTDSLLDSTETIEIVLKGASKKNVENIGAQQFSEASIADITTNNSGERIQTELAENAIAQESLSSVTLSLSEDTFDTKVRRKSDSSGDRRTVRFSLEDSGVKRQLLKDIQEHSSEQSFTFLGDLLKTSKSKHVTKYVDDNSEDASIESTNLNIGHVFVYMVVPPDGGYGWFICLISFLCQIVIDGIIYSIGILLPDIAEDFNKTGSEVILIASLQTGCYFLSGTVASAFINKYGFRPVAFTGALLSITFLTLATFSINLPMMILFHGILGGPALSMIWVSSQLVIGYYFDRYRPIASGAACSGAGVGIMLFSLMNSVLVPELGWRNMMRIHVIFLTLVLLLTLSLIEVAPTRIGRVKEPLAEDSESESLDIFYGLTNYSRFSLKVNNQEYSLDTNFETTMEIPVSSDEKYFSCCDSCLQTCCPCIKRYLERKRSLRAIKRFVIQQDPIEKYDFFYSGPKDKKTEHLSPDELLQNRVTFSASNESESSKWCIISLQDIDNLYARNTIIRSLSSRRLNEQSKPFRLTYAQLKVTEKRPILAFISPRNWLHPKIQKAFRLLFDFRLLDILEFRILLLSAFLFPMGFNIPFIYSTVRAQIDASFAKLITPTIGLSNFAFRLASGFVAFQFREYTTYICGGGMFFGGFAVFVSAFYGLDAVWFQFLYALCYGIAPAFYSTLRAIIYVQALGLDKLTNAFGLTALAMGLGVFIGTTAGGMLNDLTGSYTASFIFAGLCICSAGVLKLLLPYFIKVAKER